LTTNMRLVTKYRIWHNLPLHFSMFRSRDNFTFSIQYRCKTERRAQFWYI